MDSRRNKHLRKTFDNLNYVSGGEIFQNENSSNKWKLRKVRKIRRKCEIKEGKDPCKAPKLIYNMQLKEITINLIIDNKR